MNAPHERSSRLRRLSVLPQTLLALPLLLACASSTRGGGSPPPRDGAHARPSGRGAATTTVIPTVPLDRPFRLAFDHLVRVADTGVRLRFSKVEDSRCPQHVTCVWAGRVRAEVEVTPTEGDTQTIELGTDADRTGATVAGLRLELQGVEPGARAAGEQRRSDAYALTLLARRHR